jgi:hypothetical protein
MIRSLWFASGLAAMAGACGAQDHPRDVRTETDLEAACRPPQRPYEALRIIKRHLLNEMGVRSGRGFELDHKIPRCGGGSDDISNLWLQRCDEWSGYRCVAGPAAVKDEGERRWCYALCERHTVTLPDEQQFFRTWKDVE